MVQNLKKLNFKQKAGRPNFESKLEGLHEAILSIVVTDSFADEGRRSEVYNSVRSFDDLHKALQDKGFALNQTATYYGLLAANAHHNDGKRHVYTVPAKLLQTHNDIQKKHPDSHFAMTLVKFAKTFACLLDNQNVFFYPKMIRHMFLLVCQFPKNKLPFKCTWNTRSYYQIMILLFLKDMNLYLCYMLHAV